MGGALAREAVAAGAAALTYAEGAAAFDAGLLAGALEAVWDTLIGLVTGVPHLVGLAWDLLRSLLAGHLMGQAGALWDAVTRLDIKRLVGAALADIAQQWDDPDVLKRWFFRGKVVGEAVVQVLLTVFSDGAFAALRAVSKAGELADMLEALPAVGRLRAAARALTARTPRPCARRCGGSRRRTPGPPTRSRSRPRSWSTSLRRRSRGSRPCPPGSRSASASSIPPLCAACLTAPPRASSRLRRSGPT